MAFRKTQDEYVTSPVGIVREYGNGTFIDADDNVYEYDGVNYIKIGYDIPILDEYIRYIPAVGIGFIWTNIFFPREGKEEEGSFLAKLFAFLVFLYFLLFYNFMAWLGYKILTLFANRLLALTKERKWLRLFLPCTWFMVEPDKTQLSIGMGAVMFPLYLILMIPFVTLSANGDLEGVGLIALAPPACFIVSLFQFWGNFLINRRNKIHKY